MLVPLLALTFAPPLKWDGDWVQAGRYQRGPDGITMAINMASMSRAGPNAIRVWIRYRNDKTDAQGVAETVAYEQLDCARAYHTTISLLKYGANGDVLDQQKSHEEEPIVPDSLLSGMLPFTCAAGGLRR